MSPNHSLLHLMVVQMQLAKWIHRKEQYISQVLKHTYDTPDNPNKKEI